jgi:hypothetical protein
MHRVHGSSVCIVRTRRSLPTRSATTPAGSESSSTGSEPIERTTPATKAPSLS